jgi:hypothetical protein
VYVREEDAGLDPPIYSYFRDDLRVARSPHPAVLLAYAVGDIQASVPQKASDYLFLHAGAVAAEGDALLIPAPTGGGKSTLTAALLNTGFGYLSDDLAAIDPVTSRIHPFEKRIKLNHQTVSFFPGLEDRLDDRSGLPASHDERYVRPEDLGSGVVGPARGRWLVFPTPNREGPPRLVPIPRAEAVERMTANAHNLLRYAERGVILLSRVAGEAEAFRLDGGTPPARAELLAERWLT